VYVPSPGPSTQEASDGQTDGSMGGPSSLHATCEVWALRGPCPCRQLMLTPSPDPDLDQHENPPSGQGTLLGSL